MYSKQPLFLRYFYHTDIDVFLQQRIQPIYKRSQEGAELYQRKKGKVIGAADKTAICLRVKRIFYFEK